MKPLKAYSISRSKTVLREILPILTVRFFLSVLLILLCSVGAAESNSSTNSLALSNIRGWNSLQLGETLENIKSTIRQDYKWLTPFKDPNEEFPEQENRYFLEIMPNEYIDQMQFQFMSNSLYLIRIVFSENYFSYLKIYERLKEKYGPPQVIEFKSVSWRDDEDNILILERTLAVKYIRGRALPSAVNAPPPLTARMRRKYVEMIMGGF